MLSARTGDKFRAIAEVARKGRRVKDLRRLMNHPDLWMQAYLNIQGNKGALTRGTDKTTMDGYSPERAANLVELIRERRYKPKPVRRVNIPTKVAGKMRPLGIPTMKDRAMQAVHLLAALLLDLLQRRQTAGQFASRHHRPEQRLAGQPLVGQADNVSLEPVQPTVPKHLLATRVIALAGAELDAA